MYFYILLLMSVVLLFRYLVGRKAVHVDFFIFGMVYYFVLPGVVFERELLSGMPGIDEWFLTASRFYSGGSVIFLTYLFFWAFSFLIGCTMFRVFTILVPKKDLTSESKLTESYRPPDFIIFFLVVFLFFVFAYYVAVGSSSLFSGYTVSYDSFVLGGISTVSIFLYGVYLSLVEYRVRALKFFILLVLLAVWSTLLMSGSRMYVLVPMVGFTTLYLLKFSSVMQRLRMFFFILFLASAFILVGVFRSSGFSLNNMLYIFLAEPIFTSYSMLTFWSDNFFPLFEVPVSFLGGFYNLIPSVLWPNKSEFILSLRDMGYSIETPLGAESIVASLTGNFGWIGAPLVLFFSGFVLEMLFFLKARSAFYLMSYVGAVSVLPFMFFRDPLSVSIKSLFTLSVFLPAFLYLMAIVFKRKA